MHHIEYSVFLAFTTLTLLSKIFNTPSIKLKLFYAIFFTTMSGNLFLTEGRTGQISFILGLFVLALVSFKNKVKALAIAVILSVTLLTVAFNISTTFKNRIEIAKSNIENIITKEDYCTSLGGRVGAYISAKDIVTLLIKNTYTKKQTWDSLSVNEKKKYKMEKIKSNPDVDKKVDTNDKQTLQCTCNRDKDS